MPKSILDEQYLVDKSTGEVFDITKSISVKPEASLAEATPQYINVSRVQHCPRCNKPLVAAKAVNGSESNSFKECPECGTLVNTFKPT